MNRLIFYFLVVFSISMFSQNNLEFIAKHNTNSELEINYTFTVKNNSSKPQKIVEIQDGSLWEVVAPYVEFVAEVNINGKWRKVYDSKPLRCGVFTYWGENSIVEIKPGEEMNIGSFYCTRQLNNWFRLLDDAKVRLYFIYKIGINKKEIKKLKKFKLKPIKLVSNSIEIDYKNTLSKKEYNSTKQYYMDIAFKNYISTKYTSIELWKILKPIQNTNGIEKEILKEVLGHQSFTFTSSFSGTTKDKKKFVAFLYNVNGKVCLGIYIGKHFFKKQPEFEPLQYYFTEIPYDPSILENYLYKDN